MSRKEAEHVDHESDSHRQRRSIRRTLNWPLLIGSLVVAVLAVPAVYLWHDYQTRRTSTAFLDRAAHYESKQEWDLAAAYLHRYLQLHPSDGETRLRLAQTFDKAATDPGKKRRAVELYYQAIGYAAEKPELRQRLSELLMELGQYKSAQEQAEHLLKLKPKNLPGLRLRALAIYAQSRSGGPLPVDQAIKALAEVLAVDPGNVEIAVVLANVYREEASGVRLGERVRLADQVMDTMVAANPEHADAYLARHRYRHQHGQTGAANDIETALALDPKNFYIVLAAGENARRVGAAEAARTFFEKAIALVPVNPDGYLSLADLQVTLDEHAAAIETLQRGLKSTDPKNAAINGRLADVLIHLGRLKEADGYLKTFEQATEKELPNLQGIARTAARDSIDFLRAKVFLAERDYARAIPLLRKVVVTKNTAAWTLLGNVYVELKQWDQAASAYENATQLQPKEIGPRLAVARARMKADNLELAIRHYETAIQLQDSADVRLECAQARFEHQLRFLPQEQNWVAFTTDLAAARLHPEQLREPWQVELLDAGYTIVKSQRVGDVAKAMQEGLAMLTAAETRFANQPGFWHDLAIVYARLGQGEAALKALAQYQQQSTDRTEGVLLVVNVLCQGRQYAEADKYLRESIPQLPTAERFAAEMALVDVSLLQGQIDAARQQLAALNTQQPGNFQTLSRLAELAIEVDDYRDAERWERELQTQEGAAGSHWRYLMARRLLAETKQPQDPKLAQAARLATELETQRPGWPSTHVLKGMIAERQDKPDQAIEAYQHALRLGEERILVYERMIPLLYKQRRFADSEQYLSRLREYVPISRRLSSLAISLATQTGQIDAGLELARRGVAARPDDPMARIWLGQLLLHSGATEAAEAEFKQAAEVAPNDARVWSGLLSFYLNTDRHAEAGAALDRLAASREIADADKQFLLAQGYERIGKFTEAGRAYEAAAKLAPTNVAILFRHAVFEAKNDDARAEELLRTALKIDPKSALVRRALAGILATRGGDSEWKEAQALLEGTGSEVDHAAHNQRFRAVLLAERGGVENRKKARQILEAMLEDVATATPGDRLLLARLYDEDGMLQAAREQLLLLSSSSAPRPAHLARYVDFLLRHEMAGEAEIWLKKLETNHGEDYQSIALRGRWLSAMKRGTEIEPLVEAFLQKKLTGDVTQAMQAELSVWAGNLYTSLDQHPAAERWYRRHAELVPGKYELVAKSLLRQDRVDEALALCVEATKHDNSPAAAAALASVLAAAGKGRGDSSRGMAEELLEAQVRQHGSNVEFLFSLATLRVAQERPNEAIELYEKVVRLAPKHFIALNNLAFMLAEQHPDRRKDALVYIDQAIQIAGPVPTLLDTKAMVLLYNDQPTRAIPLLEKIATVDSQDARWHLHLAMAYRKVGAIQRAKDAIRRMRDADLDNHVLTPEDKRLLSELQ